MAGKNLPYIWKHTQTNTQTDKVKFGAKSMAKNVENTKRGDNFPVLKSPNQNLIFKPKLLFAE